jgi:ABC-type transport system involved in multi-copper enzyme maturation permease subunit
VIVAAPDHRRARLAAYAPWQCRDYLMDRGAPTVLIGLLFGYMVAGPMVVSMNFQLAHMPARLVAQAGGAAAARAAGVAELTATLLVVVLGNLVFLGALFAMNGIVANDRKQGYYRFLFAKPISPERYYGQAFVLHWGGFLVVTTLLGLLYQALVGPVLTARVYAAVGLMYLCYAGIAFALSAAARWDWLSLVAVTVASNYLWLRFGGSTNVVGRLVYLLPPIHRTSEVYAAAARGSALPWELLAWFAGYGVACFAIGLVVLRYRRLAIV